MICQEVMELMQRYIDDDLNQQETSLMMDHAGQCPDCAAMLARLQKLSSELEQLPRVVPKFSLVDAILPELERLHAVDAVSGSSGSGEGSNPVPSTSRSHRPARLLFRKISSVVAAGVVVGLLLFSNPGQWTLGGSGSSNDAAAPNLLSAPAGDESRMMKKNMEIAPNAKMPVNETEVKDQAGENKSFSISGSGDGGTEAGIADKNKLDESSAAEDIAPTEENPSIVNPDGPPVSGYVVPASLSESPDKKWKAIAVEDAGTFQVYKTEDESLYYTSEPRGEKIGLFEWNEESTVLYFTVTDAEGSQSQWQFDTVTSQESKR